MLLHYLHAAHAADEQINELPQELRPTTVDAAYAIADALAGGRAVGGWKIGASNARFQQAIGLREPFAGRAFAGTLYPTPAQVRAPRSGLTIGAEVALRIGRDLDPAARYDAESIAEVVDAALPVLELNWPAYRDPFALGGLCIIADNGFNVGLVLGEPILAWRALDLRTITVRFQRNTDSPQAGSPADVDLNPLAALAWLANDRAQRGDPLRAGQVVATGDFVGAIGADTGSHVTADFASFGRVEMILT